LQAWRRRLGHAKRIALRAVGRGALDGNNAEGQAAAEAAAEEGEAAEVVHVERQRLGWLRRTLKRLAGSNLEANLEERLMKAQELSGKLETSLAAKEEALNDVSGELEVAKDRGSKEQELREALEDEVKAISKAAELSEARLRRDLAEEEKKAKALQSAYEELNDAFEGGQTETETELQRLREQLAEANQRAEAAEREKDERERELLEEKDVLEGELEQERARSSELEQDRAEAVRVATRAKKEKMRLRSELDVSQETLSTLIMRLESWKSKNSSLLRPSGEQ